MPIEVRLIRSGERIVRIRLSFISLFALAVFISSGCTNPSTSLFHSVTFTVTATNGVTVAEDINYSDTDSTVHSLANVALPWTLTVSMPVTQEQNSIGLSAQAMAPSSGSVLTATISDDGLQVATRSDPESGIYMAIDLETLI